MAKRTATIGEHTLEGFSADLSNLLGSAREKADSWLGQRKTIVAHLEEIRDTAANLLEQMGHQAAGIVRPARKPGRPTGRTETATILSGKKRKVSAKARAAMSAAQKKRWAKQRASEKK